MNRRAKMERALRRRNLALNIDLAYTSLRSHLADAVKCRDKHANNEFHARCCRDYAQILYTDAIELYALTKQDFKRKYDDLCNPI